MKGVNSFMSYWKSWDHAFGDLQHIGSTAEEVTKVEVVPQTPLDGAVSSTILHNLGSAATVLTFSLLTPILTFFLLIERDALGREIGKIYKERGRGRLTWQKIVKSSKAYFLGNLVLAGITYPIFAMAFFLFAIPSFLTIAALATVFNLVPFAGSIITGFLPAMALYTQTQTLSGPLTVYISCMLLHFVVADLVTPKILGSQVNLNATASTVALVAWGELWGPIGLLLAIPLTSTLKILFEDSNFYWLKWLAGLMSEKVDVELETSGHL